jgi:benzaldehyde dehydrogenase (NAD)
MNITYPPLERRCVASMIVPSRVSTNLAADSDGAADIGRNRLKTGLLHINDQTVADEPHVPFGGSGASGNGTRIGGPANWDEFTQWQWMTIKDKPNPYPF